MKLSLIDFTIVFTLVLSFIILSSYFAAKKVASKNLKRGIRMDKIILKVKKISKSYNNGEKDLHVLQNLSLKVKEKEIVTITGKSGSGKSTLLNILGSLDQPDNGEIQIDGHILNMNNRELARLRNKKLDLCFNFIIYFQSLQPLKMF